MDVTKGDCQETFMFIHIRHVQYYDMHAAKPWLFFDTRGFFLIKKPLGYRFSTRPLVPYQPGLPPWNAAKTSGFPGLWHGLSTSTCTEERVLHTGAEIGRFTGFQSFVSSWVFKEWYWRTESAPWKDAITKKVWSLSFQLLLRCTDFVIGRVIKGHYECVSCVGREKLLRFRWCQN